MCLLYIKLSVLGRNCPNCLIYSLICAYENIIIVNTKKTPPKKAVLNCLIFYKQLLKSYKLKFNNLTDWQVRQKNKKNKVPHKKVPLQ